MWSNTQLRQSNLNRNARPSLLIVLSHEFIYTWQLVPLEFNLSTLISLTNLLPSINYFVCVWNACAFSNWGVFQDERQKLPTIYEYLLLQVFKFTAFHYFVYIRHLKKMCIRRDLVDEFVNVFSRVFQLYSSLTANSKCAIIARERGQKNVFHIYPP